MKKPTERSLTYGRGGTTMKFSWEPIEDAPRGWALVARTWDGERELAFQFGSILTLINHLQMLAKKDPRDVEVPRG